MRVKSLSKIFLFILIVFTAQACAKKQSELKKLKTEINAQTSDPDTANNAQDINLLTKNASIECKNLKECNHSVGMVLSLFENEVKVCSGFLISKDVFLTSSQCISKKVFKDPSLCKYSVRILFPDTGVYQKASTNCENIIEYTNANKKTGLGVDYVFIKLKPSLSNRERLELSRFGLENKTSLFHYRLDLSDSTNFKASLQLQKCTSIQKSFSFPFYTDNYSPIVSLGDCEFTETNTGSPLIDEKGFVRAIALSNSILSLNELIHKIVKPSEAYKPLSYAVNSACIPNPNSNEPYEIDPICNTIISLDELEQAQSSLMDKTEKQALTLFKAELNKPIEPDVKAFIWKGIILPENISINGIEKPYVFTIPECYNLQSKDWLKEYDMLWGLGFYKKKATRTYKLPVYKLSIEFDEYRVPIIKGTIIENIETFVDFSPRYAHKEKPSPLRVRIKLPNSGNIITIYDNSFSKCE
jgi:hypothetical protein